MSASTEQPTCLVVEATASATLYGPELIERGYRCGHIRPFPEMLPIYRPSFRPQDFFEEIIHRGDLQETLEKAESLNPKFVIVGNELGVELGDWLSENLGLPGNGIKLSTARRNKHSMLKAIADAGIQTPEHIMSEDINQLQNWAKDRFPVVLKPLDSAGTDGVRFCTSPKELNHAFDQQMNGINRMGLPVSAMLVEEFIDGPEYCVNTVSWQGKHMVTDVWRNNKIDKGEQHFIYDHSILLSSDDPILDVLLPYTFNVLDAVGIKYGAGHTEVRINSKGPIIMETAARVCGSGFPAIVQREVGRSQISVAVDAYTNPSSFEKHLQNTSSLSNNVYCVYMHVPGSGLVQSIQNIDRIESLESFHSLKLGIKQGDTVAATDSLFNQAGMAQLVHKEKQQLEKDLETLREIEKSLYTIN